jgi:hypothetical protein
MSGQRYNLSDQRLASWYYWWFRRVSAQYLAELRAPADSTLSEADRNIIWNRVEFIAAERFPGEPEARLADVLRRTRAAVDTLPDSVRITRQNGTIQP